MKHLVIIALFIALLFPASSVKAQTIELDNAALHTLILSLLEQVMTLQAQLNVIQENEHEDMQIAEKSEDQKEDIRSQIEALEAKRDAEIAELKSNNNPSSVIYTYGPKAIEKKYMVQLMGLRAQLSNI